METNSPFHALVVSCYVLGNFFGKHAPFLPILLGGVSVGVIVGEKLEEQLLFRRHMRRTILIVLGPRVLLALFILCKTS